MTEPTKDLALALRCSLLTARAERAERERDEARQRWTDFAAALEIHDEWEPLIEPAERRIAAYVKNAIRDAEAQRAKQAHLVAELATLRPVVDAARAFRVAIHEADEDDDWEDEPWPTLIHGIVAAVDALPATEETTDGR